jgi:hypothetical protein
MSIRTAAVAVGLLALTAAGCHIGHAKSPAHNTPVSPAQPTTQPATAPTRLAQQQTAQPNVNSNVTPPPKPFIAVSNPFEWKPAPSVLLQQHARSDSPVPLSLYPKQPTHALEEFNLRSTLSADEVQKRLGPPAQLADYSSTWFVYRLHDNRELWLHFAQPDNTRLLYADVIWAVEDGYSRERVFAYDGSR